MRRWLGHTGARLDVILGVDQTLSIDDMVRRLHLSNEAEKAERMAARFRELGTEQFALRSGIGPPHRRRGRRAAAATAHVIRCDRK